MNLRSGLGKWNAIIGSFAAWMLAACGFWVLVFTMHGIKVTWGLSETQTGALISVTLASRFVGAVVSGAVAEAYGKKSPLLCSIGLCGVFGFLGSVAPTYKFLLLSRALFGVGLGGIWVAGMALALEPLRGPERGIASGLLQGGWNWGYVLAAVADSAIQLTFGSGSAEWHFMLGLGALPLLVIPWILTFVHGSPVNRSADLNESGTSAAAKLPLLQILSPGLITTTIHTSLIMAALMSVYYSLTAYYPKFLATAGLRPLWFVLALNVGGIMGELIVGKLSSTRLGRRYTVAIAAIVSIMAIPFYLHTNMLLTRMLGAFFMGASGLGMWGVVPRFLADRFPSNLRAMGPGVAYHAGALIASPAPVSIGWMLDRGIGVASAMSVAIVVTCISVILIILSGPESWNVRSRSAAA